MKVLAALSESSSARNSLGLLSWNLPDAHSTEALLSPTTSKDVRMVWIFGSRSCNAGNGGGVKAQSKPPAPDSSPVLLSAGDRVCVCASSRL